MTEKKNVIITDRFSADALGFLKNFPLLNVSQEIGFNRKSPSVAHVHGLIIRSKTQINEELLKKTPQLKVVITATNGFDHIDLKAADAHNVAVFYCPEGNTASAAELTWSLVLACARRIPMSHASVKNKNWKRDELIGTELMGKTYGIIGLGRIGRRVARIAHAFSMKVLAYDPYVDESAFEDSQCIRAGLVEVLRSCDVVSVHVPYTRETHHMMNRMTLSEMSPHSILVNTSRGSVIAEQDLADVLSQGELGAAGLDVFEREPLASDSSLLSLNNVVLTPHIGANTHEAFDRVSRQAAEKLVHFFKGEPVLHPLPPRELWFTHPKGFN